MKDEPYFEMILHVPGEQPLHIREAITGIDAATLLRRIVRPVDLTSGYQEWEDHSQRVNARDDLAAYFGRGMAHALVRAHNERIGGEE